jgi:uncharacterized protein (TIGR03435 family)
MRRWFALVLFAAPVLLHGQAPEQKPLTFEVASVKANTSGGFAKEIGPAPDGHFHATNVPPRDLIAYAYGISQDSTSNRIVGAPKLVDDERYDVNAKVTGAWTPDQMREMVRAMLMDRFKLAAHRETREMPMYALVVASENAPRLRRSHVDQAACEARRAAIQRREPVPPPVAGAPPICGSGRTNPGTITAIGFSIESLSSSLGRFVGRVVTNKTNLTGLWDFDLTWTPEQATQLAPGAPPIAIDPNGPSIFTALQEQLGLKLDSTKGPVDVLVIDHVERPTPD